MVVDNLSSGSLSNLPRSIEFQQVDLANPAIDFTLAAFRPETIFHFAAQIDVNKSISNPLFDAEQNVLATLRLLEYCRNEGTHFIFASSGGAIYGEAGSGPQAENHPEFPINPYGVAKLAIDRYLFAYHHQYQMPYTSMRFSNVYGPRQNTRGEAGVVAIFCERLMKGLPPIINGDGLQTRDFVYVKDLAKIAPTLLRKRPTGVFNLGTGIDSTILTMTRGLVQASGRDLEIQFAPARPGEQRHSVLDPDKAQRKLGWVAEVSLAEGILETMRWFQEHQA